jgi:hypothetical protein
MLHEPGTPLTGGCSSCGGRGGGRCIPGRKCNRGEADSFLGRCFGNFYECVCCPDPCYEPRYIAAQNNAFFQDTPRPVSHMRIRFDHGEAFSFPDRAEYFFAKIGANGPANPGQIRYRELSMYNEAATEKFGLFVEMPYRSWYSEDNDAIHEAGFGDINLGTKTALIDCDLLLLTFQFRTFLPTALSGKGLGTGHTTLEPSLLLAIHLCCDTYLQSQFAYAIPVGGNGDFQGDIWHYHLALNRVLCRPIPDWEVVASGEFNSYLPIGGSKTDAAGIVSAAHDDTIYTLGASLRLNICDKTDVGFGTSFAVSNQHWADELYRFEFRWRF